jgi:hypothetical protein
MPATMSYRISDPISYWFNFANVTNPTHSDNAPLYARRVSTPMTLPQQTRLQKPSTPA